MSYRPTGKISRTPSSQRYAPQGYASEPQSSGHHATQEYSSNHELDSRLLSGASPSTLKWWREAPETLKQKLRQRGQPIETQIDWATAYQHQAKMVEYVRSSTNNLHTEEFTWPVGKLMQKYIFVAKQPPNINVYPEASQLAAFYRKDQPDHAQRDPEALPFRVYRVTQLDHSADGVLYGTMSHTVLAANREVPPRWKGPDGQFPHIFYCDVGDIYILVDMVDNRILYNLVATDGVMKLFEPGTSGSHLGIF
ncbi:hypothetical protein EIP91_002190 [Steccherinum ochraceum]|uniref:Uncharacterized protein n=1 Tax=Steccherinum ochraceum TaxID=92696 RepID=A0A4V2MWE8_9APHY|nr:hypothetical protein EIP91_002190 [Steccherinum ochraceum]